ncbi:uncharacterized protein LOC132565034 [Ylistrum balloti]|uniref:uncharacterized protein LOC132565034 n=1 Tax=Ylistrum balloti TaxID=509963 RepID=UPI002905C4DA|nr:uncharacterized protein LOC132565034 [Ylistrum balloti]
MSTQRVASRLFQKVSMPKQHSTISVRTMALVNYPVEAAPPSSGMMNAWRTLQQDSWVTTQGHAKPQILDTFSQFSTCGKSVLGTRYLGELENIPSFEKEQSIVQPIFRNLSFKCETFLTRNYFSI